MKLFLVLYGLLKLSLSCISNGNLAIGKEQDFYASEGGHIKIGLSFLSVSPAQFLMSGLQEKLNSYSNLCCLKQK